MPLIAVMGPMTGNGDASGELAVFVEYRKLPRETQNNRDEHDE